jgi:hypothetical protein
MAIKIELIWIIKVNTVIHSLALKESDIQFKGIKHSNKSLDKEPGELLNPDKRLKMGSRKIKFFCNRVIIKDCTCIKCTRIFILDELVVSTNKIC